MSALEKFIAFFVNRHLLTNLMFVIVFFGGVFAWYSTSKKVGCFSSMVRDKYEREAANPDDDLRILPPHVTGLIA